jgi:ATP-dependent Clp protease adaptor protein ClpS
MPSRTPGHDVDLLERTDTVKREKKTPPFRVILLNDDYTPMDFVVDVLIDVFGKPEAEAVRVMLAVHFEGAGLAGVYPHEIAETKVDEVRYRATAAGHPLRAIMEEGGDQNGSPGGSS